MDLPENDEQRQDDELHRHDQSADEQHSQSQPPGEPEPRQTVRRQAGEAWC